MRVLYTWLRGGNLRPWRFEHLKYGSPPILSCLLTANWGEERRPVGQFRKLPETKHLSFVLSAQRIILEQRLWILRSWEKQQQKTWDACKTKCTWSNGGISNPLIRLFALDCTLCIATAYLEQQSTKVGIKVNPGKHSFLWKLHFWPIFDKSAQLTTVISKSRQ